MGGELTCGGGEKSSKPPQNSAHRFPREVSLEALGKDQEFLLWHKNRKSKAILGIVFYRMGKREQVTAQEERTWQPRLREISVGFFFLKKNMTGEKKKDSD